ncbi:MAG: hypothetical protein MET45_01155 [Nostoc sp. LLA-1]|nr:hypothetical protein [Cyanocohniella sp. LLY]
MTTIVLESYRAVEREYRERSHQLDIKDNPTYNSILSLRCNSRKIIF